MSLSIYTPVILMGWVGEMVNDRYHPGHTTLLMIDIIQDTLHY